MYNIDIYNIVRTEVYQSGFKYYILYNNIILYYNIGNAFSGCHSFSFYILNIDLFVYAQNIVFCFHKYCVLTSSIYFLTEQYRCTYILLLCTFYS